MSRFIEAFNALLNHCADAPSIADVEAELYRFAKLCGVSTIRYTGSNDVVNVSPRLLLKRVADELPELARNARLVSSRHYPRLNSESAFHEAPMPQEKPIFCLGLQERYRGVIKRETVSNPIDESGEREAEALRKAEEIAPRRFNRPSRAYRDLVTDCRLGEPNRTLGVNAANKRANLRELAERAMKEGAMIDDIAWRFIADDEIIPSLHDAIAERLAARARENNKGSGSGRVRHAVPTTRAGREARSEAKIIRKAEQAAKNALALLSVSK